LENSSGGKMSIQSNNEMKFKHGFHESQWSRMAVPKHRKDEYVALAKKKRGPFAPNGLRWEDFFVVEGDSTNGIHDETPPSIGQEVPIGSLV
jgi:hypothetical protein